MAPITPIKPSNLRHAIRMAGNIREQYDQQRVQIAVAAALVVAIESEDEESRARLAVQFPTIAEALRELRPAQ